MYICFSYYYVCSNKCNTWQNLIHLDDYIMPFKISPFCQALHCSPHLTMAAKLGIWLVVQWKQKGKSPGRGKLLCDYHPTHGFPPKMNFSQRVLWYPEDIHINYGIGFCVQSTTNDSVTSTGCVTLQVGILVGLLK